MSQRRSFAAALAGSLAVAALAGCGGEPSPSPSSSSSPVPSTAPEDSPSPSPSAGTSASPAAPSVSASPSSAAGAWDGALLAVLPADIDGRPLTPQPEAFAASASDPSLTRDMEAGAVSLVVDTATSGYAVIFVYRLRPGVFDDGWFRAWRDSFDTGVCEQAGGVAGRSESELGGRTVHIGSCAGGVLTYHAHLASADGDLVVSSQSLGDERMGERVMSALQG